MEILNTLIARIEQLEQRTFLLYVGGGIGAFVLLLGALIYFQYSTIENLHQQITQLEELREDAQKVLVQFGQVEQQKDHINKLLQEDPNFKIGEYTQEVLSAQGLTDKVESEVKSYVEREGTYRESIVQLKLNNMSMQALTKLLDDIEHKRRVYTKALEVAKSKKNPRTIEVTLTIATLQPREQAIE